MSDPDVPSKPHRLFVKQIQEPNIWGFYLIGMQMKKQDSVCARYSCHFKFW